jgi:ubiquinone/menaquinone biosynthesis C-methylase UbiE
MSVEKYVAMQRRLYDEMYSFWSVEHRDPAVGSFDGHNRWGDYEFLWRDVMPGGSCLDFGCGPGRNIVRFNHLFERFDGVDLCPKALSDAELWIAHNGLPLEKSEFYLCNGLDLSGIGSGVYDVVISTICLEHICVYDIRFGLLREFFRVLKSGGAISLQMGFGGKVGWNWVDYFANRCDAVVTNGHLDVSVTDPKQLEGDLLGIGFVDFRYHLRPPGPGDDHVNWIYFSARKP